MRARPASLERHLRRRLAAVLPSTLDAPPLWRWPPAPLDPAARAGLERGHVDEVLAGRFTFLNQTLAVPEWSASAASRQWLFQLHGFRWAIDLAIAARRGRPEAMPALQWRLQSWLERHPPDAGDAWHPFVVSERLLAWLVVRDLLPALRAPLRTPILLHAIFLQRHLETDVGGNHQLKNLVALLLAGCAFDGPAPVAWRTRAAARLERQLALQILPDGGHYERSPMYHLLVLADLLAALWASGRREMPVSVALADAVRRMQSVARALVHPDGDIPLFNDSVLDEAPRPAQLIGPSTEPAPPCLPWTGYASLRLAEGVLIADCGSPGPNDLPAHVHADALSFELSVGTQRVFVDGGMAEYAAGALRDRLRGSESHNTLQVDGEDQSEVYGAFRVGRRARVRLLQCSPTLLVAEHDGYARLGVRHERRFDAFAGHGWRILDTVIGSGFHVADARLRLHPAVRARRSGFEWLIVDGQERTLLVVRPIGWPSVNLESGLYAERFNVVESVRVLRLRRHGRPPFVFGCWLLLPGAEPIPG
ncbi:MAG: heparinase II/III family protein [Chloroflexota bacterium]|nr:heparinase II/III family protein [Chloroflexota bacterium]